MSIKLRLLWSNIALIIIPIFLFMIASGILVIVFLGDIREMGYLLPESHSYHKTIQKDSLLFFKLKEKSAMDPDELLSKEYLESLSNDLDELKAGMMIRKDNKIIYTSTGLKKIKASEMPKFGAESSLRNLEQVGKQTFSIKQHDFYLKDGSEISLFLMKDASPWNQFVKTFFPILFGLCLLILILTNGLLTYFMSKSIIKPIDSLKKAAQSIRNGRLDHSITAIRKDEIGQLTETFEEMRLQLKESFEIQKQYEENRKELIAHISHDLKTPITSIKGYIEGIRDGVADTPEKRTRYIQTIHSKAVDLDHLIDELFLFSKLDLRKVPFHFEKVDMKNFLEDFTEELTFDHMDVNITYQSSPNGLFFVKADREKFKRVIGNIVDNSLKYMDKEVKRLNISLSSIEEGIHIIITDNGPGIPEESIPFIFNQFYRAEQSRNTLTGGSGLGLSIARMIVEEHQGHIFLDSKVNLGTKISILLPHYIGTEVLSS
jgi:histidine kinase